MISKISWLIFINTNPLKRWNKKIVTWAIWQNKKLKTLLSPTDSYSTKTCGIILFMRNLEKSSGTPAPQVSIKPAASNPVEKLLESSHHELSHIIRIKLPASGFFTERQTEDWRVYIQHSDLEQWRLLLT